MESQPNGKNYRLPFIILTACVFAVFGYYFETGMPPLLMALMTAVIGVLSYFVFAFLLKLTSQFLSRFSSSVLVSILAVFSCFVFARFLGFRWPTSLYYGVAIALILLTIILSFSFSKFKNSKSLLSILGILMPVVIIVVGVWWLLSEGVNSNLEDDTKHVELLYADRYLKAFQANGLMDPSAKGKLETTRFTYGSNNDKHRPEFTSEAKYHTKTVDASLMLPEWKGKKKKWRERYWGFGVKEFPINGRVDLPKGEGPFPIALIVHGNHSMIDYSDEGYNYLTEMLASRGIIAVSVDENFINGHWSGDFRGKEMPARAWLLLQHLKQWRTWNDEGGHELFSKADLSRVMLVGHSRGGEAVSIAAAFNELPHYPDNAMVKFDFGFGIKSVVSLAPTDYRYHREIELKNLNYLSLQGSYDADEVSFWGMRPYRRLEFTDSQDWIKAGVYLHKANHGQFNSTWGRKDFGPPTGWLLNTKPMMSATDQQKATQIFISAFAEATLKNNKSYLPVFKDVVFGKDWLPKEYYLTHFSDSDDIIIQNFEEDINIKQGHKGVDILSNNLKIWREQNLETRDGGSQENNVVVLGWDNRKEINMSGSASYKIVIDSAHVSLDDFTEFLIFEAAAGDYKELDKLAKAAEKENKSKDEKASEKKNDSEDKFDALPLEFSIKLRDYHGNTKVLKSKAYKPIAPQLKTKFTKMKNLDQDMIGDEWEIHLESICVPLYPTLDSYPSEDLSELDAFILSELKSIEFIFDKQDYGVLVLDNIGFSMN